MKSYVKIFSVLFIISAFWVSCELFGGKANSPQVTIMQPDDDSNYTTADLINFLGEATDTQDGILTGTNLTWISSIDDTLGHGTEVSTRLSAGEHVITLKAVDIDGNEGSDAIHLTVTQGSLKLDKDYSGFLHVRYINTYPDWDVETQVTANIVGDSGVIRFGTGQLDYSGETLVSTDSKISREGEWVLAPTGELVQGASDISIEVDGGVTVQNDVQKIWAYSNGSWVLVNETPFDETPDASLVFSLDEALTQGGSQCGISVSTGSIMWTLTLIEE